VRDAVARAERELGRLDLAVAVAPDEGAALALDALRKALAGRVVLGERPVMVLEADADAAEALQEITRRLYN
jgi:hypothetical protein